MATIPPGVISVSAGGQRTQRYFHDFFNYAGLHRSVWLYATPGTYIDGITVSTGLDAGTGEVRYHVDVVDEAYALTSVVLRDAAGQPVASATGPDGALRVPAARPWQPGDPYLYRLDVMHGPDEYSLPVGIRTVRAEAGRLLLNGAPVRLRGFGMHEDGTTRGKGHDDARMVRDFALLDWVGANSFRTSHYPYAEEVLDYADRRGLLVIDEAPAVGLHLSLGNMGDAGARTFTPGPVGAAAAAAHLAALRELIARDRNHPCVIAWSIANEPDTAEPAARDYFAPLAAAARDLDATRPICFANVATAPPDADVVTDLFDLICVNRYYGWYADTGDLRAAERHLEEELRAWARHGKPVPSSAAPRRHPPRRRRTGALLHHGRRPRHPRTDVRPGSDGTGRHRGPDGGEPRVVGRRHLHDGGHPRFRPGRRALGSADGRVRSTSTSTDWSSRATSPSSWVRFSPTRSSLPGGNNTSSRALGPGAHRRHPLARRPDLQQRIVGTSGIARCGPWSRPLPPLVPGERHALCVVGRRPHRGLHSATFGDPLHAWSAAAEVAARNPRPVPRPRRSTGWVAHRSPLRRSGPGPRASAGRADHGRRRRGDPVAPRHGSPPCIRSLDIGTTPTLLPRPWHPTTTASTAGSPIHATSTAPTPTTQSPPSTPGRVTVATGIPADMVHRVTSDTSTPTGGARGPRRRPRHARRARRRRGPLPPALREVPHALEHRHGHAPRMRLIVDNDYTVPSRIVQLAHHCSPRASSPMRDRLRDHLLRPHSVHRRHRRRVGRGGTDGHRALRPWVRANPRRVEHGVDGPRQPRAERRRRRDRGRGHAHRYDVPLWIACGGGLTNLASALLIEPAIAGRLTALWIGGQEHPGLAEPERGPLAVEYDTSSRRPRRHRWCSTIPPCRCGRCPATRTGRRWPRAARCCIGCGRAARSAPISTRRLAVNTDAMNGYGLNMGETYVSATARWSCSPRSGRTSARVRPPAPAVEHAPTPDDGLGR